MKTISRLWGGVATHIKENTDLISTHNYLSDLVDLSIDSTRTNKDIIDSVKAAEFPSSFVDPDTDIINSNLIVCSGNTYHVLSKELTTQIISEAILGAENESAMSDMFMDVLFNNHVMAIEIDGQYQDNDCNEDIILVFNVTTESSVSLGVNADSNTLKNYILPPGYYVYRGIDDIQDEEGNHIDWLE